MKNAARLTDFHQCPAVSGAVPHVGGPAMAPGAPSVLVGGLPAARVSDLAACAGPPDTITRGAPSVMIEGKHAGRRGDGTAHGGVIMVGHPMVLIGGEMPTSSDAQTIQVAMNQIRASDFAKTPEGQAVLAKLEQLQKEGKLTFGELSRCDHSASNTTPGANWDGNQILLDPAKNRSPDSVASSLVHEGSHAMHTDQFGHVPDSIDEETPTNQNQQDFYEEQRQSGHYDSELERRRAVPNLRDDVRSRYPTMPEHESWP